MKLRCQADFNGINGAVRWKFNLSQSDPICSVSGLNLGNQ